MRRSAAVGLVVVGAAVAAGALLASCSEGTIRVRLEGPIQVQGPSVAYEGVYVSERLMDRIEVGRTTADWLLAVIGEPTEKAPLRDGSEIWKWTYRPVQQQASLLNLLDSREGEPTPGHIMAFVRLENGVVVEKWRG